MRSKRSQADVIDPSDDQSTAAVLDKVSGAGLIRARQQQARIQFLAGDRRADAGRQQAQPRYRGGRHEHATSGLRDGRAAGGAVVAGAADDLRTWRQP